MVNSFAQKVFAANLSDFKYNKTNNTLYGCSEQFGGCFPVTIDVKSHVTGSVVRFVVDQAAAIDAEFWDGEMMQYKSTNSRASRMVLSHSY